METLLDSLRGNIRKIQDGRLGVPTKTPFVELHNTWLVNHPGTLLVIPVGDLAQHAVLGLCYMLQNGLVMKGDINRRAVPGIEKFKHLVDPENYWPLTFVEQLALGEVTAELAISCYAGALMLQAMGLGGWMFNGMEPFVVLGASGYPGVPGLGFRCDENED